MRLVRNFLATYHAASRAVRRAGAAWYREAQRTARALARRYGVTLARAAGVIAALSPRLQWAPNVRAAERVLAGQHAPGVFGASLVKAQAIAAGAKPLAALGGNKVRAFYRAIMGDMSAAVIDVWTARAAGVGKDSFTDAQYAKVADALREAARRTRTPVATFQAIAWVQVRGRAA